MYCIFNCGDNRDDCVGTYKVYDCKPSFNLVLNNDGSVRVNTMDGKDVGTYGSWEYYNHTNHENICYITMDDNFRFLFGFSRPILDIETSRLYVSLEAYESKNPNKYYKVFKTE